MQCLSITLQCGAVLHLKALASIKLRNAATSTRKVSWHSDERSTRLDLLCIFFAFWFGIIALSIKDFSSRFLPYAFADGISSPRISVKGLDSSFFIYHHLSIDIVWAFGEVFWEFFLLNFLSFKGGDLPSARLISAHAHRDDGFHDHAITILLVLIKWKSP